MTLGAATSQSTTLGLHPTYWMLVAGLGLAIVGFRVGREILAESRRLPIRLAAILGQTFAVAAGVALLSPFIVVAADRVFPGPGTTATTGATAQPALDSGAPALLAIVLTLISAYSLNAIQSFEKKKDELDSRIRSTDASAQALLAESERQAELIERNAVAIETNEEAVSLQRARMTGFLRVADAVEEIGGDAAAGTAEHATYMDLKLLQRLLTRKRVSDLVFDVRELVCLMAGGAPRFADAWFSEIFEYLRLVSADPRQLEREYLPADGEELADLVTQLGRLAQSRAAHSE